MDYKEEQRFNFPFIIGLFIFFGFAALVGVGIITYNQITANSFENEMLIAPFVIIFSLSLAYYLLFKVKLETSVNASGITYRYFPYVMKHRLLQFSEIATWRITPYKNIIETGGIGYRSNMFTKKVVFIMSRGEVLELKLANKRSISFSTENAYLLSAALKKYMPNKELK